MKRNGSALRKKALPISMLTLCFALVPAVAFAAEGDGASTVEMVKYIAAASSMVVSAVAAAFAQAKIGVAAAGTIAEKPEAATMLIVLQALPEIIVLLGFVSALIISG